MDSILFLCRRPAKQPKESQRGPRWIKDKAVYWCKHCQTDFSLVVRRHHCRHCGQVFCGHCTKNKRPLIKFGYTSAVRLCTKCNALCFKSDLLLNAVGLDDLNTVRKICEEGIDVTFTTTVFPPLTIAANRGFSDMVRLLLKYGGDPCHAVPPTEHGLVVQCSSCGKTSAFDSSRTDHMYECPFCQNATRHEANNEVSDVVGITPLHASVQKEGHLDCLVALLEANANVDAKTAKGNTALMYACAGGHLECCKVLIAHGADVHVQTEADGDVPLHKAVREGHVEVVELLMDSGARSDVKNNADITPRMLADRMRNQQIIAVLSAPRTVKPVEEKKPVAPPAPVVKPPPPLPKAEGEEEEEEERDAMDVKIDAANRSRIHQRVDKWVEEAHKATGATVSPRTSLNEDERRASNSSPRQLSNVSKNDDFDEVENKEKNNEEDFNNENKEEENKKEGEQEKEEEKEEEAAVVVEKEEEEVVQQQEQVNEEINNDQHQQPEEEAAVVEEKNEEEQQQQQEEAAAAVEISDNNVESEDNNNNNTEEVAVAPAEEEEKKEGEEEKAAGSDGEGAEGEGEHHEEGEGEEEGGDGEFHAVVHKEHKRNGKGKKKHR